MQINVWYLAGVRSVSLNLLEFVLALILLPLLTLTPLVLSISHYSLCLLSIYEIIQMAPFCIHLINHTKTIDDHAELRAITRIFLLAFTS